MTSFDYFYFFDDERLQDNIKTFFFILDCMTEAEAEATKDEATANSFFICNGEVRHNRNIMIVDTRQHTFQDNRQNRNLKLRGLFPTEKKLLRKIRKH